MVAAAIAGPSGSRSSPWSSKRRVHEREAHAVAHGRDVDLGEDLAELLDGAEAAGHAAVGHEAGGLPLPLAVAQVDRLLERRRVAVVVLGGDHDEGVGPVDAGGVGVDGRVAASGEGGGRSSVEQVDHVDARGRRGGGLRHEPAGDGRSEAAGAGAPDDDGDAEGVVGSCIGDRMTSSSLEVK